MAATYIQSAELQRQLSYIESVRHLVKDGSTFHIYTYGCQQNDNDSEKLSALLQQMGYTQTNDPEQADLILMNTCSVRGNADHRFFGNLGIVKTYKTKNPDLIVGVCGCMMQIDEHVDKIRRSFSFVDLLFGTSDVYRLPELLYRRLSGSRRVYDVGGDDVVAEGVPVAHERKYRALCTIMYGCNNFCSYCIVPYTRGRERSRQKELVLQELKELADQGFSEVMLLGQNVNAYGKDLPGDRKANSFASLLDEAARTTGIRRIRFMTSHPKDITSELLEVMARHDNIENHLHLPVQCGSDRILRLMNRHYTIEHYMKMINEAKRLMPDLGLSTDIIVGFPGETEEDFQKTLDVVAEVGYDSAFTFQYSPRIGTPAALEENQVPQDIVSERFNRLVELTNANSLAANERRVGTTPEVLIEGVADHRPNQLTGRSSDNHLINFSVPEQIFKDHGIAVDDYGSLGMVLEGRFADVKITTAHTFSLQGELVRMT